MPHRPKHGEASTTRIIPIRRDCLMALQRLALADLARGHNISAAHEVLAMLARVGVRGAEA